MTFSLNKRDFELLQALVEYRIFTVNQISALFQTNKTATAKRVKAYKKAGLVEVIRRQLGRKRGRPEELLGLTEKGFVILKEQNLFEPHLSYEAVISAGIHCPDHQLLINWFRIHLQQVQRVLARWNHDFFASSSPLLPLDPEERPVLNEYIPSTSNKGKLVNFKPDAVFVGIDAEIDKALLFFLEVDMG